MRNNNRFSNTVSSPYRRIRGGDENGAQVLNNMATNASLLLFHDYPRVCAHCTAIILAMCIRYRRTPGSTKHIMMIIKPLCFYMNMYMYVIEPRSF